MDIAIALAVGVLAGQSNPWFIAGITSLVVLASFGLVWLIFVLFVVPYQESKRLESDKHKMVLETEPEHPLAFSILPPYHPAPNATYVGIEIQNTSLFQVDCHTFVQTQLKPKAEKLGALDVSGAYRLLVIPSTSPTPFYFAAADTNSPNAILNTFSDDSRRIHPGTYALKIIAKGLNSKGKEVEHAQNFVLVYHGADQLELKEAEANNERTKETAQKEILP